MSDPRAQQPMVPWTSPSWEPAPRPSRPWLIPAIVVGAILLLTVVLGVIVLAVLGVVERVQTQPFPTPDQPLVEGDAGSPIAVAPLICVEVCLTGESVDGTLATEADLAVLGVPDVTFPSGTYDPVTAGELFRRDSTSWKSYNGGPDACFFAPTSAPYAASLTAGSLDSSDLVYFLGTHEDESLLQMVDFSARVFPDSAAAEGHMAELSDNIGQCSEVTIGPPGDRYSAQVNPAAGLDLPDSVAAVGWSRTGVPGPGWRAYVFDLQRGNVVVRVRLITDGDIHELEFRSFVEYCADELATLEPLTP